MKISDILYSQYLCLGGIRVSGDYSSIVPLLKSLKFKALFHDLPQCIGGKLNLEGSF